MPIEVKCPGCQALLRIADENLGRQSRCPSCFQVFTAEPPQPENVSPFVAPLPDSEPHAAPWQATEPQTNPYAPTFSEPEVKPSGPLVSRRITVDEVISKAWLIFKKNWVMACVVVAILGGVNFACSMLQNGVLQVINAVVGKPAIAFTAQAFMTILTWLLQIWLQLGQTMVMLDIARGRQINVSKLFAGGPFLLNGIIAMLLAFLLIGGVSVVLIGLPAGVGWAASQTFEGALVGAAIGLAIAIVPIVVISLAISQMQPLIVDRHLSGVESLRESYRITQGNKFTLFLIAVILMVISFVAGILGFLMLCIGIIPAMIGVGAYSALVFAVAYLSITDQRIVVPGSFNDPRTSQVTSVIP